MRKILFLLCSLLFAAGAWANEMSIGYETGTFKNYQNGDLTDFSTAKYAYRWVSTSDSPTLILTTAIKNNMVLDGDFRIATDDYTLSVDGSYAITGYSFKAWSAASATVTPDGQETISISADAAAPTAINVSGLKAAEVKFNVVAGNPWMYVTDFVVTYEEVERGDVTYNIKDAQGNVLATQTESLIEGSVVSSFPESMVRAFTSYAPTDPVTIEAGKSVEYNVVATFDKSLWNRDIYLYAGEDALYGENGNYVMYGALEAGNTNYVWQIQGTNPYDLKLVHNSGTGLVYYADYQVYYLSTGGAEVQFLPSATEGEFIVKDITNDKFLYTYSSYIYGFSSKTSLHAVAVPIESLSEIQNPSFDVNPTYGTDATDNLATAADAHPVNIDGWTQTASAAWSASASYAFGTAAQLNGASVPAAPAEGSESTGALGVTVGWGGTILYAQTIDMPAGNYKLSYKAYNAGTATQFQSKVGIIAGDNSYLSAKNSFALNTWEEDVITFTLAEDAAGATLQVGGTAISGGSNSNGKIFFDDITIEQITDADMIRTELENALAEAQKTIDAKAGVGEGLFMIPTEDYDTFVAAVAEAQAVADNAEASAEELKAAKEALDAATATYAAVEPTQPDPNVAYSFQLKDGGLYMALNAEEDNVWLEEDPQAFYWTPAAEGGYYLTNENGYVGHKVGTNPKDTWTMSAAEENKIVLTATPVIVDGVVYYTIDCQYGSIGLDDTGLQSKCWCDKSYAKTGDKALWTIAEVKVAKEFKYSVDSYVGAFYEGLPIEVELEEIMNAIGATSTDQIAIYSEEPDGTRIEGVLGNTDGWRNAEGAFQGWGADARVYVQDNNRFAGEELDYKTYYLGGMMNQTNEVAAYTVKLVYVNKETSAEAAVFLTLNYIEPEPVVFDISDLDIQASVEYETTEGSYVEKSVSLTDEQVASILAELGLESLEAAEVYGYNPTTKEFVVNHAGFDGWRDANGDFHNHTGNAEAPICVKYTDGKTYLCYNITGLEAAKYVAYWAITNGEKAVLVKINFKYNIPVGINAIDADLENAVIYDLSGRRVSKAGKGVFIINGKKVALK